MTDDVPLDGRAAHAAGYTLADSPWSAGDPAGARWRAAWVDAEADRRDTLGMMRADTLEMRAIGQADVDADYRHVTAEHVELMREVDEATRSPLEELVGRTYTHRGTVTLTPAQVAALADACARAARAATAVATAIGAAWQQITTTLDTILDLFHPLPGPPLPVRRSCPSHRVELRAGMCPVCARRTPDRHHYRAPAIAPTVRPHPRNRLT